MPSSFINVCLTCQLLHLHQSDALQMHQCLMIRNQVTTTTHNPQQIPMLYLKQNRKCVFQALLYLFVLGFFCNIYATFHPVTSQTALRVQWVLATSKHLMFLNRSGVFFSINRCMIPLIDKSWHLMCLYEYNQCGSSYKYCSIALLVDYY